MIPSLRTLGGYVWKFNPRITTTQKSSMRKRMSLVDENIDQVYQGLCTQQNLKPGTKTHSRKIDYFKFDFPKSPEMKPRDKYTSFSPHYKDYRKPIHRIPKWTKLSFREDPTHF